MITKTAIGLFEGSLFALPHAIGFHQGDESAGSALLNTGGDVLALKAGDAIYNGVVKPKNYAFLGRNQDRNGLLKAPSKFREKRQKIFGYRGPFLAKHWGRALGHGIGRIALSMPMFTLTSNILTPIGDKLLPYRRKQSDMRTPTMLKPPAAVQADAYNRISGVR